MRYVRRGEMMPLRMLNLRVSNTYFYYMNIYIIIFGKRGGYKEYFLEILEE